MLHLDLRVTLEAIILDRLERIPAVRRQEWLRGLLVQGFRVECQVLRATESDAAPGFVTRTNRFSPSFKRTPVSTVVSEPTVVEIPHSLVATSGKPFATLGKVIG